VTAYELQKDIAEEVEGILKCMLLKDIEGNLVHMKAFPQRLPKRLQNVRTTDTDNDDAEISDEAVMSDDGGVAEEIYGDDPYPYCVVKVNSGELDPVQGVQEIQTLLIFGIYDNDAECQGHHTILNMIHKVSERFTKNPYLKEKYRLNFDAGITWLVDDEDQYPYYFGAMEMTWDTFFAGLEGGRYA